MKPRREWPVIMSKPMVLSLNARRKLQTRRTRALENFTDRGHPIGYGVERGRWGVYFGDDIPDDPVPVFVPSPYGAPTDRLWVREGVRLCELPDQVILTQENGIRTITRQRGGSVAEYIADGAPAPCDSWGWKNTALPSIHMPRGMCRHLLDTNDIRVERVQSITEADAVAEGLVSVLGFWSWPGSDLRFKTAVEAYRHGWEWLNDPESWAANPWVWRIAFSEAT
jgi:hypothetical protein